ncbi:MAG: hypothetical protein MMC23_002342 [Stictis urceolatum]|nr:hypothetical protein [Stictis urceolata]
MARLRIVHSSATASEKIFDANRLVSQGTQASLSQALKIYTEILYTDSPGHICALLNRALAYIGLGYPELAVTDAYRAAQICHDTRRVHVIKEVLCPRLNTRSQAPSYQPKKMSVWKFEKPWHGSMDVTLGKIVKTVEEYIRLERLHFGAEQGWTIPPDCYIRRPFVHWLQTDLSSLVLGDWDLEPEGFERPLFEGLEIRAVYRMTGALWLCGGGAVSDAIALTSDVMLSNRGRDYWIVASEEMRDFRDLSNAMIEEYLRAESENLDEANRRIKTKITMVNRVVYPWNTHHPSMDDYGTREAIEMLCDNAAPKCIVRHDEATDSKPFALRLVAAENIAASEVVLRESTLLQAVTPCAEYSRCEICSTRTVSTESTTKGQSDRDKSRTHSICPSPICEAAKSPITATSDTMGQATASPLFTEPNASSGSNTEHQAKPTPVSGISRLGESIGDSISEDREASRDDDIRSTIEDSYDHDQCGDEDTSKTPDLSDGSGSTESTEVMESAYDVLPGLERSLAPSRSLSPHSQYDERDLNGCPACRMVTYCSALCAIVSDEVHETMCNDRIPGILEARLNFALRLLTNGVMPVGNHPKATYLQLKLFLKTISLSETRLQHPLDLDEIKVLNGGLFKAPELAAFSGDDSSDDEDNKEEEPPNCQVKALPWSFDNNVVMPMRLLKEMGFDAWENLDKLDGWVVNTILAKIDHSMRITKGFKQVKIYDSEGNLRSESVAGDTNRDEDVWIGTVHPVFSLVPTIDLSKGGMANISVTDIVEIECRAGSEEVAGRTLGQASGGDVKMEDIGDNQGSQVSISAEHAILRSVDAEELTPLSSGSGRSFNSCVGHVGTMSLAEDLSTTPEGSKMDLD